MGNDSSHYYALAIDGQTATHASGMWRAERCEVREGVCDRVNICAVD